MSEKLKPCPFCGGTDIALMDLAGWEAWCRDCGGCAGCTTNGDANTRDQMIAAWNRRELESASQPSMEKMAEAMHDAAIRYANGHTVDFQHEAREFLLESDSQPGGGEAVKVDAVRANFTPFYIMSNVRRIVPAYYNKQRANWVLAMDVFAVGSRSARQICWDAGIDPDGYAIISVSNGAAPSAGNGGAEDK